MTEIESKHPEAERFIQDFFGENASLISVGYNLSSSDGQPIHIYSKDHPVRPDDTFTITIVGKVGEDSRLKTTL